MSYIAIPHGDGPWPGVVVIHEMFGVNDDIKGKADRLATQGYLALAVDLFGGRTGLRCMMAAFRQLRAGSGPMMAAIDAARAELRDRGDCTGKVGVIGFCMGGGFALLAASELDFAVAAPNYGQLPKDPQDALRGACPIVGSYGAKDLLLRGTAATLERVLTDLDIAHDVKEYPGASHSFMTQLPPRRPMWLVAKLVGIGYAPDATSDAWRRIDEFFARYLKN